MIGRAHDPLSILYFRRHEPAHLPALIENGSVAFYRQGLGAKAADRMQSLQEHPGEALVVLGDSTRDTVVTLLAAIALGLPVFPLHPRWPEEERRRYLADLGLPPLPPGEPWKKATWPAGAPALETGHERILAVLPTSGSSGRPKGVALSRRAFHAAIAASAAVLGWQEDDRWLLSLPLAHVGGLSILLRCLAARRAVVLADPASSFDPAAVARQIERDEITLLSWVPTQLRRMLQLEGFTLPPKVRAILIGGAAASPALLESAAARGWPCLVTYGSTEAASQIATQRTPSFPGCGPPVQGVEVQLGESGRVSVRGENLLSYYLPSGASGRDAHGFFATGDLGRWDAMGNLHILGRADDVIVTGGENVHPLQVEAALEEDPAIAAAAVFPLPDEEWGQLVAAAVVPRADASPDLEEVRARLRQLLPGYALPRRLFTVDALPQNAVGKLDRRALAARFAGGPAD